ncbi:MAG: hypothetical protein KZQ99_19855 [Candidatus Thiodiazotropha sp. (ex Dulcina madagascariensis)]|nr:hypothetical protein [Candidatus Thiodiazotropha sp. (ex Dulcina madagascariensis)]
MEIIRWFAQLSFPVKIIVGAVGATIAGPGLIAFLSEYATYFYALDIGIRPPLEGIPYLSATVAMISLILALLAATIFLLSRLTFAVIGGQMVSFVRGFAVLFDEGLMEYRNNGGRFFRKLSISESLNSIRNLTFLEVISLIAAISIVLTLIFKNAIDDGQTNNAVGVAMYITIYIAIAIFTLWRSWFNYVFGIMAATLFYVLSWQLLFDFDNQKNFLKTIGYGGEIPLLIEYENGNQKELSLQFRTTGSLIGTNDEEGVIEIPIDKVYKINYLNSHDNENH